MKSVNKSSKTLCCFSFRKEGFSGFCFGNFIFLNENHSEI